MEDKKAAERGKKGRRDAAAGAGGGVGGIWGRRKGQEGRGAGEAANWLATERKSEASFAKVLLGMKNPPSTTLLSLFSLLPPAPSPSLFPLPTPRGETETRHRQLIHSVRGLIRAAVISRTSRPTVLCSLTPTGEPMLVHVGAHAERAGSPRVKVSLGVTHKKKRIE